MPRHWHHLVLPDFPGFRNHLRCPRCGRALLDDRLALSDCALRISHRASRSVDSHPLCFSISNRTQPVFLSAPVLSYVCSYSAPFLIPAVPSGLWHAENKWDEEGSAAYIKAAGEDVLTAAGVDLIDPDPEGLETVEFGDVTIPEDAMKAAFPVPWGFLVGWWVWGISYLFPVSGNLDVDPTVYGYIAMVVCFLVSFVASVPMSDAVMNRLPMKKKVLSLMFLLGWIVLGIMSALDVNKQLDDASGLEHGNDTGCTWVLCLLGPITVILSQKILFESRKMGTLWEESGKPNFHPVSSQAIVLLRF